MALPAAIVPGGDLSAELFRAVIPARLRDAIDAGTAAAVRSVRGTTLPALYPGSLAARWAIVATPGAGAGARIDVTTDDPRVIWYERGTRPHQILPVRARALHWTKPQSTFAARVNHPGTRAHNRLPALQAALDDAALTEWGDAIEAAFASLSA